MDSRPWTPPEIEDDSPSRPGYFNLFGTSPPKYPSAETEQRWLREANRSMSQPLFNRTFKLDTPTRMNPPSRPKPVSTLTEPAPAPYTPTPHSQGALRYPYTPDSSQILRRTAALPATPSPWDDDSEEESASPVQNALSSCIAHFENLIHTHQPDEDQMEYIVGQFEAMAAHLSGAPPKDSDEDRFQDATSENGDAQTELLQEKMLHHEAYVAEVGNYVAGVQKYIDDLKMRMDEVKTLNSIQQDVINDLRTQMKIVRQGMHDSLHSNHMDTADPSTDLSLSLSPSTTSTSTSLADSLQYSHHPRTQDSEEEEAAWETIEDSELSREIHAEYSKLLRTTVHNLTTDPPAPPRRRVITIVRKPQRRSFWSSFGEALDEMADVLDEQ